MHIFLGTSNVASRPRSPPLSREVNAREFGVFRRQPRYLPTLVAKPTTATGGARGVVVKPQVDTPPPSRVALLAVSRSPFPVPFPPGLTPGPCLAGIGKALVAAAEEWCRPPVAGSSRGPPCVACDAFTQFSLINESAPICVFFPSSVRREFQSEKNTIRSPSPTVNLEHRVFFHPTFEHQNAIQYRVSKISLRFTGTRFRAKFCFCQ